MIFRKWIFINCFLDLAGAGVFVDSSEIVGEGDGLENEF